MSVRTIIGDCRTVLPTLPAESVHCCVTSPPYWGLRDYGTGTWEGGNPGCDHSTPRSRGDDIKPGDKQGTSVGSRPNTQRSCSCGARRIDSQIGVETTFDQFIAEMVAVFREVRRVLRKDGTLWLNLGDSYASSVNGRSAADVKALGNDDRTFRDKPFSTIDKGLGLKPKDMVGIPWRVALALQADGWWLRQDIIWSKPNPMPESVTDRCTKAHEYLFLMTRSERYYYDAEAIREPIKPGNDGSVRMAAMDGYRSIKEGYTERRPMREKQWAEIKGANKRSVWEIATNPFPDAHFATFPPALVEPCILAGCPKGGTVLDPFGGAGTTGLVADRLQRNAILIELNSQYAEMAEQRVFNDAPLLQDWLSTGKTGAAI